MRWFVRGALASVALGLVVALAACGTTASGMGGTGAGSVSSSTGSGAQTTAVATRDTHASPGAPAGIVIAPGAEHYAVSDTITVTIRNRTGQTVYVQVRATDCSAVALERLVAGAWESVRPCAGGSPHPGVAAIAPGTTVAVSLAATAPAGDTESPAAGSWPAGTYRARVTYTTSASEALSQGMVMYSATFRVG